MPSQLRRFSCKKDSAPSGESTAESLKLLAATRIDQRSPSALDQLRWDTFIISLARQYQNQGRNWEELLKAGSAGLTRAQQQYGHEPQLFQQYASWWVRQAIANTLP
jgi:DNA-directed RNA polymerase sigma subunit (sigma70/sigma32)